MNIFLAIGLIFTALILFDGLMAFLDKKDKK